MRVLTRIAQRASVEDEQKNDEGSDDAKRTKKFVVGLLRNPQMSQWIRTVIRNRLCSA